MLFRWFFRTFLLLSFCFTTSTVAQITPRIVSEPCSKEQNVPVVELRRKTTSLRDTLDNLESERGKLPPDAKAPRDELDKRIRANQEALIEMTLDFQCH